MSTTASPIDQPTIDVCCDGSWITIPKEGWYSFFLDINTTSSDWILVAKAQHADEDWNAEDDTKTVPLPFSYLGEALVDGTVGMIVFLSEGASISVTQTSLLKRQTHKRNEEGREDTADSIDDLEDEIDTQLPEGSLIFRQTRRHRAELLSTLPKSLVCRSCLRSFATWHALDNHCIAAGHSRRHRQKAGSKDASEEVYQRPLPVLFQDDAMAVVVKPQGLPVQGTSPCLLRSPLLTDCLTVSPDPDALRKPRPVHRLDSPTGGVLVVAKTRSAEAKLRLSFAERACHKRYRAIVNGCVQNDTGCVNAPIQDKEAVTTYKVVQRIGTTVATVVDLWPVTGRFHQLRRHMKSLGHPLVGDKRYGRVDTTLPHHARLSLFAMEITLPHPVTGESMTCQMEDPEWLTFVVDSLNKQISSTSSKE